MPRTRPRRHAVNQRIEGALRWIKTVVCQDKTNFRGRDRVGLTVLAHCRVIGHWPIAEVYPWDRDYLGLVAPVAIIIGADNRGEIGFWATQASVDLSSSASMVFLIWAGFDRWERSAAMASPNGSTTRSLEVTFTYQSGHNTILNAKRRLFQ